MSKSVLQQDYYPLPQEPPTADGNEFRNQQVITEQKIKRWLPGPEHHCRRGSKRIARARGRAWLQQSSVLGPAWELHRWTESCCDWMNKTKPDNIPVWKTQEIPLVAEQLWQLVAAEREIHCPQGWASKRNYLRFQEMPLCKPRSTKTE